MSTDKDFRTSIRTLQNEVQALLDEHIRLKDFYKAILAEQPYKPGDRIVLSDEIKDIDYRVAHGWSANQGMLQPGNSGTVTEVSWNDYYKKWQVAVLFDLEWSLSDFQGGRVYLKAPKDRHSFYLGYRYIHHAPTGRLVDPILPPPNVKGGYCVTDRPGSPVDISYTELVALFGKGKQDARL